MDKMQKGIVNQLVGMKGLTDYDKEGEKRFYIDADVEDQENTEGFERFCLTQVKIEEVKYIKVWSETKDDFGMVEKIETLGFVKLSSNWHYGDLADLIEHMIKTY